MVFSRTELISSKQFQTSVIGCSLFVGQMCVLAHPGLQHDIDEVSRQIEASPDQFDLLIKRATLYRLDHKPAKALADLEQAARLGAKSDDLVRERAFALADAGRASDAEEAIRTHLSARPNDWRALALLGRLCAERDALEAAVDAYRRGIEIKPNVEMVVALGRLLEASEQFDAAAALYGKSLAQLGKPVVLVQSLVNVEITRGQYDRAMAFVEDMIECSPVSIAWRIERARIYRIKGELTKAKTAIEFALTDADRAVRRKRTAINLYHRARVLFEMLRYEEATKDAKSAIKLAPGFLPAAELLHQITHKKIEGNQ